MLTNKIFILYDNGKGRILLHQNLFLHNIVYSAHILFLHSRECQYINKPFNYSFILQTLPHKKYLHKFPIHPSLYAQ